MNRLLVAVQFITLIPIIKDLDYSKEDLAGSMIYYPIIGTILGVILGLIGYMSGLIFSPLVTSSLLILGLIILTGGIHLDGVMDTCDGVFSGYKQEKMLTIMRDSRTGAFGVLGVVGLLLVKFSLLVELAASYQLAGLIYALTMSRWAMVISAYFFRYAREEGLGQAYANYLTGKQLGIASLWTLLVGGFLFTWRGLIMLIVVGGLILIVNKWLTFKLGGLTGDTYGMINELVEVISLLILAGIN